MEENTVRLEGVMGLNVKYVKLVIQKEKNQLKLKNLKMAGIQQE